MKYIKVELNHFPPSKVIVKAVGIPYNIDNPTMEIVNKVVGLWKHESVSEHITLNFTLSGFSRAILQQLARHRMASPTVKSTRYSCSKLLDTLTSYGDLNISPASFEEVISTNVENFVIPEKPDNINSEIWREFLTRMHGLDFTSLQTMKWAKSIGIPADCYKYLIVENFRSKMIWTINFRSLINFLALRMNNHAHPEIIRLASLVKSEVCRVPYIRNLLKIIDNRMTVEKIEKFLNIHAYGMNKEIEIGSASDNERNYDFPIRLELIEQIKAFIGSKGNAKNNEKVVSESLRQEIKMYRDAHLKELIKDKIKGGRSTEYLKMCYFEDLDGCVARHFGEIDYDN